MNTVIRKKSPRAPSISLDDAIEKISRIYDKDRCHAAPLDGVAQHIGFKNANNGSALSAIASLKYYGLLDRPKEGMGAVSKEYEAFRFAPTEEIKRELMTKWLKAPPVFAELLDKYPSGLPSDTTLKFELIQRGFAPVAADSCLQVFRKSVDYARYFELAEQAPVDIVAVAPEPFCAEETQSNAAVSVQPFAVPQALTSVMPQVTPPITLQATVTPSENMDRIPVRLGGGRRAWIEIPAPFYEADKDRLKKQIDLLITDDEENNDLA